MERIINSNLGKVATSPDGSYDSNREYMRFQMTLYDHDSWVSKKDGNKGHTPADGSEWWYRATHGGKHAYEEGETAKEKGNTAQQQGNTTQEQGNVAQQKGNEAHTMALFAQLMAQHPPVIGKSLPGHAADDNWWYYFVPNAAYTDGTYVRTDVYSKGDNLEWDALTEEEKEHIINEILASFIEVTEEQAAAVFHNYVFETTD